MTKGSHAEFMITYPHTKYIGFMDTLKDINLHHLSIEMQTTMLLERKRPKIRKNEQTRHKTSPAHHETVMAHMISSGIIRKTTCNVKEESARNE